MRGRRRESRRRPVVRLLVVDAGLFRRRGRDWFWRGRGPLRGCRPRAGRRTLGRGGSRRDGGWCGHGRRDGGPHCRGRLWSRRPLFVQDARLTVVDGGGRCRDDRHLDDCRCRRGGQRRGHRAGRRARCPRRAVVIGCRRREPRHGLLSGPTGRERQNDDPGENGHREKWFLPCFARHARPLLLGAESIAEREVEGRGSRVQS